MKRARRRRKYCALAVVRRSQKFSPRRRPLSRGAQDGQNLTTWRRSLPLPTDPVWWGSMHAFSSYRGNRPTHTTTNRQDRLRYTAPQLARSVNILLCLSYNNYVTFRLRVDFLILLSFHVRLPFDCSSTALRPFVFRPYDAMEIGRRSCRPTNSAKAWRQ